MFFRAIVSVTTIFALSVLIESDASARGRGRCRPSSCCSSWGGSYGSCGSSGGCYVPNCSTVCHTVVTTSSYGSCGASGGSYVQCGSVGGGYTPTAYYQPMVSSLPVQPTVVHSTYSQPYYAQTFHAQPSKFESSVVKTTQAKDNKVSVTSVGTTEENKRLQ